MEKIKGFEYDTRFLNLMSLFDFQMMVEEVKKAKELAAAPKPKGGDDEPDWQDVSRLERF
jgi:hypothetical protein